MVAYGGSLVGFGICGFEWMGVCVILPEAL